MKTIYYNVKNPKIYLCLTVAYTVIVLGIIIYDLVISDERNILNGWQYHFVFVWLVIFWLAPYDSKIVIDDQGKTLTLGDITHFFYKRTLDISAITVVELHKKKNGKLKKLLIRTTPNIFYSLRPYYRQEFIEHITRLNSNIQLVDRKASFVY